MGKFPTRVDLEVTNLCGLRCVMCPRKLMTRPVGFMSMQLVEKVIKEIDEKKDPTFDHVALHQIGEPLLHPNIVEIVKLVKRFGLCAVLTTTATLLTESISRELFAANVDALSIDLDSLDKQQYARIRVGADLDVVRRNIDQCIEMRQQLPDCKTKVDIQTIMMRENAGQVAEVEKEYGERIRSIGGTFVAKTFEQWGGVVPDMTSGGVEAPSTVPCTQAEFAVIIQWNGDAVICCMDYDGKTKVGNVYESTIEELWLNDLFNSYRRRIKEGDKTMPHCGTCPHLWRSEVISGNTC